MEVKSIDYSWPSFKRVVIFKDLLQEIQAMTTILIGSLIMGLFSLLLLGVAVSADTQLEKATFAGGCFWCMQPPFEKLDGVISVVSGYTGGTGKDPNYQDYAEKGHIEAVEITYDPSKITYPQLLDVFWRQIDPYRQGRSIR